MSVRMNNGIPVIIFGDGDIGMGATRNKEGDLFGVHFAIVEEGEVGRTINKKVKNDEIIFRILTKCPEGLSPLIRFLQEAQQAMREHLAEDVEDD